MKVEIHLIHHYPEIENMSDALENLTREVTEAKAGTAAAVVLIEGIRAQLLDMADDATSLAQLQAQIDVLATDLSNSTDALAAAVVVPGTGEPTP